MKKIIIALAIAVLGVAGIVHAAQPAAPASSCCDGGACCGGGACCASR